MNSEIESTSGFYELDSATRQMIKTMADDDYPFEEIQEMCDFLALPDSEQMQTIEDLQRTVFDLSLGMPNRVIAQKAMNDIQTFLESDAFDEGIVGRTIHVFYSDIWQRPKSQNDFKIINFCVHIVTDDFNDQLKNYVETIDAVYSEINSDSLYEPFFHYSSLDIFNNHVHALHDNDMSYIFKNSAQILEDLTLVSGALTAVCDEESEKKHDDIFMHMITAIAYVPFIRALVYHDLNSDLRTWQNNTFIINTQKALQFRDKGG